MLVGVEAAGMLGSSSSVLMRRVPFVPRLQLPHRLANALSPTDNLMLDDVDLNTNTNDGIIAVSEHECIPQYLQIRGGDSSSSTSTASSTEQHMLDGSNTPLTTAMALARSQARLLVVYIPAKGRSSNSKSNNGIATQSLQSKEVARAANRPSKKKKGEKSGNSNIKLGSFLIWSAENASSAEISAAMKRLKAKHPSKGGTTSPILLVAYVAQSSTQLDPSTGRPKLQPRVLAQHHGNPPPNPTAMAAWLSSLRKRHGKQYAVMQHQKREAELFVERQKGYADSQVEDREREIQAQREEEERLAKEHEEKERKAAMEQRRKELAESLPDEPEAGCDGVVTIALRFADGRRGQRRFDGDEEMATVFNWVDGMFRMERERVELSTMTGQKKFVWSDVEGGDVTLTDAGLGKMTGLRVAEIEDDHEEEGEEDGDEEEEESDDE